MTNRTIAVWAVVGALLVGNIAAAAPAAAGSRAGPVAGRVEAAAAASPAPRAPAVAFAAAVLTPAQAVARARSESAANGITDYVSVVDRRTGAVLAQSPNAGTQVASESIVKLMIAAYYLVLVGGYRNQSASVLGRLSYMIRYSDDSTASAYFTSAAVPTIAARYGMRSTINATDRVGHWGAARITAHDMTTFLYRAINDPQVGPWLGPVMAQVAPVGSDGFNQAFGMNSLSGTHGSKQGWGNDQFWSSANQVINSVGFTDRYFVAILQNSYSYPDPARATSTFAARTIQASRPAPAGPAPLRDGDFVRCPGIQGIYRLAGGAPIYVSNMGLFPRNQPIRSMSLAQWKALPKTPRNGTLIKATGTGQVFRVAGGAPTYVSTWQSIGGVRPTVVVDAAAISRAGGAGIWSHLAAVPADGTFVVTIGRVNYRIVRGAPTYVHSWAPFGGIKPTTLVDGAALSRAGQGGVWSHLRNTIPDTTYIYDAATRAVFRMAGGAPVFVSSWAKLGGPRPAVAVDGYSIAKAGGAGPLAHLRARPANGTFIKAAGSNEYYRVAGGAPLFITNLAALSARPTVIVVDRAAVLNAGRTGYWAHLAQYPATGTYLMGRPTGIAYRTSGGRAVRIPTNGPFAVQINQSTIDRAGTGGAYNHLRK